MDRDGTQAGNFATVAPALPAFTPRQPPGMPACPRANPRTPAVRRIAMLGTLAFLAMGTAMTSTFPQAAPRALHPDDDGYRLLMETATAPLHELLGDHVVVEAERLDCLGRWVFLLGNMRTPGGERPDFRGTRYADHAAAGSMSDVYVALLRRDPVDTGDGATDGTDVADGPEAADCLDTPGEWVLLDHSIGPGDVSWLDWPQEHAAPRAVFGF